MIDIHSHILPMVDDGSQSVEESLAMLDQAYRHGTDAIILTPHFARPYGYDNPRRKIKRLFDDLTQIVKQERIPIDLYLGCEFLFSSRRDFRHYREEITTLNQTRYLLYEFYFDVLSDEIIAASKDVLKAGYIPVIAHPERYDAFQVDLALPYQLMDLGVLLQMNKGSINGDFGPVVRDTVMRLLSEGLIALVGSDAHDMRMRHPRLMSSYRRVSRYFGSMYADEVYNIHPERLLRDEDIRGGNDL